MNIYPFDLPDEKVRNKRKAKTLNKNGPEKKKKISTESKIITGTEFENKLFYQFL